MSKLDDDYILQHYGVKGMKWGVRRAANKDAKESARAKMFYGDGAGTRRKLIKAKVESRSKRDPEYKKAFDEAYSKQDLGKHANKASSERRRKDVRAKTGKTARGVYRSLTGGMGSVSMASAAIASAYLGAKALGVDKVVKDAGKKAYNDLTKDYQMKKGVENYLRSQGLL